MTKVYLSDKGHGVTQISREYWSANKSFIGEVESVECFYEDRGWVTEVTGSKGKMALSGFASGYSGEGAHGLYDLLKELGAITEPLENTPIPNQNWICYYKEGGKWKMREGNIPFRVMSE